MSPDADRTDWPCSAASSKILSSARTIERSLWAKVIFASHSPQETDTVRARFWEMILLN